MTVVKIALLGAGTVGTQVARLLSEQKEDLAARSGAQLELVGIAVRDVSAPRDPAVDRSLLTDEPESIIDEADVVIELMGGIEPARSYILRAFAAGASVVTGNKALLAAHGPELYEAAARADVDLYYEAAVAGAVPVVYGLRESLAGDRITAVLGIVNGTTNYILDEMTVKGLDFDEALAKAQELGYAEADPTADVDGLDAAAKCAILASLAFHTRVGIDDVHVHGIRSITKADIESAGRSGCVVKLVASASSARVASRSAWRASCVLTVRRASPSSPAVWTTALIETPCAANTPVTFVNTPISSRTANSAWKLERPREASSTGMSPYMSSRGARPPSTLCEAAATTSERTAEAVGAPPAPGP